MDYVRYYLLRNDEKDKYCQLFKANFGEFFTAVKNWKQYLPFSLKEIQAKKIKIPENVDYLRQTSPKVLRNRKTLFFDLDETLIHTEILIRPSSDSVEFVIDGIRTDIKLNVRPYMYEFLNEIKKYYDLCVFTASQSSYAKTVINQIDPGNKYFR